jgi:hypothetical protein
VFFFCDSEESTDHLFILCLFDHLVWRVFQFTLNISHRANVTNIFRNWLNETDRTKCGSL